MNNILKEIKLEVQRKINIQKNKEVSTDQEVLKIINNLKDYNNSTKCYLIRMYAAIYFDNLSLLEYLEKNNFSLGTYPNNIAIYLLDNSLTKYFTKESYLDYLIQYKPYFQGFFLSLKYIDYSLKDYYIKRFIYLTITNQKKLQSLNNDNNLLVSNKVPVPIIFVGLHFAYFKQILHITSSGFEAIIYIPLKPEL